MENVLECVKQQFPHLYDYEDCWPVNDLVLLCLKYLSLKHHQNKTAKNPQPSGKQSWCIYITLLDKVSSGS
ncbi:hypothetical protein ID866_13386 [Astraeus odoratus]|nr:hypothetical protein ID866_13386 [Astraeus odoratus]